MARSNRTAPAPQPEATPEATPETPVHVYEPQPDELQVGEVIRQRVGAEVRRLVVDSYRPLKDDEFNGVVIRREQGTKFLATWRTQADLDSHLDGKFPGRYERESVAIAREAAQAEAAAKAAEQAIEQPAA